MAPAQNWLNNMCRRVTFVQEFFSFCQVRQNFICKDCFFKVFFYSSFHFYWGKLPISRKIWSDFYWHKCEVFKEKLRPEGQRYKYMSYEEPYRHKCIIMRTVKMHLIDVTSKLTNLCLSEILRVNSSPFFFFSLWKFIFSNLFDGVHCCKIFVRNLLFDSI